MILSAFALAFSRSIRRRLLVKLFEIVGDGKRLVFATLLAHAVRPDRVGQVCPVVLALLQTLPGFLEFLLPFGQGKQFLQRRRHICIS